MRGRSLALLAALAAPVAAHAQEVETGELVVMVFETGSGEPMQGVAVRVGDEAVGSTDRYGRLVVEVEPGVHPLAVEVREGVWEAVSEVRITAGYTSESLVTWFPDDGHVSALVEQPGEEMTKADPDEGPTGIVRGRIVSSENGEPVANARIFVRGSRIDAQTNADGTFELEIGQGSRDLSIIHDKFATQSVNNVEVVAGQETPLSVELVPAGLALDDFTIRAPKIEGGSAALLDERRTSSAVGDVLGAEQMARSGDSSAAGALGRVTGLTVVGGKYVYVRGLGERYSSVLLNGATLPSPEPGQRVVPLDMFPAGILESVVIQKTFSPDMPGEFGGGSIQLRTKNIPTEPVFRVGISSGGNSVTTFQEGLDYQGQAGDFFGMGAAGRRLPAEVKAASDVARVAPSDQFCRENCYTDEDLERFGEQMPAVWSAERRQIAPDLGLSLTAGTGSESGLFGRPAGILYGTSFKNEWETRSGPSQFYSLSDGENLQLVDDYTFLQTSNQVNWSHILAVGASPAEGHEIRSTSLVLRRTGDETRIIEGENDELDTNIRQTRLRYVERMLLVQQLAGEHRFGDGGPSLTWRYSYARATRVEPDRRQTQYDQNVNDGVYRISSRSGGNLRFFGDLLDQNHDVGGELKIPFGPEVGEDAFRPTLRVGGMFATKVRSSDTRRFRYAGRGELSRDADTNAKDAEEIFIPENIGTDGYVFEETTLPTDNYSASHQLLAGYAMAEVPFTSWLRVMAGARLEKSNQQVTTFPLFSDGDDTIDAGIDTLDLLPAATVTVSPIDKANVRLGYGRTVSRPDFREMSPAVFFDVGRNVTGNPELERAILENYDMRFELYPSPGETLSLGAFYKDFTQPIETVLVISAERSVTWENADSAWLAGVEFDVRKSLEFVADPMRDFYVAGNVALIQSRVQLPEGSGAQTRNVRPMQGQSPWVVNASLGYDNPDSNAFVTVLYNVFGPRITAAGAFGQPDTYEEPIHSLSVAAGFDVAAGFRLGVGAKNLLGSDSVYTMGDKETQRVELGRDVSIKLSWGI